MKHRPATRFAKWTDEKLFARRAEIIERMDDSNQQITKNVTHYTRDDVHGTISGTVVNNAAGRGIGRLKDDGRILEEVEAELSARGYSESEIARVYDDHYEQREREAIAKAETAWDGDTSPAAFDLTDDGDVKVETPAPQPRPKASRKRTAAPDAYPETYQREPGDDGYYAWIGVTP